MIVDAVFAAALALFQYTPDEGEHWASYAEMQAQLAAKGYIKGDCEDFAAWCVAELRKRGLLARYVVCDTETGERHVVAETGGLVLDNRQVRVERADDLPYRWLAASGTEPGQAWRKVRF